MKIELTNNTEQIGFWEGESPFGEVLFCNSMMGYLTRTKGAKFIIDIRATAEEGYQKIELFRHWYIFSFDRWRWQKKELSTYNNIFLIKDKVITKIIRQVVPKTKLFLGEATLYVKVVAI